MNQQQYNRIPHFLRVLQQPPAAVAEISGSSDYPELSGTVQLYRTDVGTLVTVQVFGLPVSESACKKDVFAFHIHSGTSCTGNETDPFADALTHYNPEDCEHPNHAGDLPPLWGNDGYAFEAFLTDRFSVQEVVGKTVIVHRNFDDFTSQPAGNAGEKIACGTIETYAAYRSMLKK